MRSSLFALAAIASAATASPGWSQAVVDTPEGRVEFIGLKKWTVQMVQDSFALHAPGVSLASYACAAALRSDLRFADASVQVYPAGFGDRDGRYVVITVVEPSDSARVRYRDVPPDTMPLRPEWEEAAGIFTDNPVEFQLAIRALPLPTPDDTAQATPQAVSLRAFLRAHRGEADLRASLTTLATDGNAMNRVVAALILANFQDRDTAWWALTDALRDPDGRVSTVASQVLWALAHHSPRPVDWSPVTRILRHILSGTNLFAHNTLMEVLATTKVDPALAPSLMETGELVLAKARSHDPTGRKAAIQLLTELSGHDFGENHEAWEDWLKTLPRSTEPRPN